MHTYINFMIQKYMLMKKKSLPVIGTRKLCLLNITINFAEYVIYRNYV